MLVGLDDCVIGGVVRISSNFCMKLCHLAFMFEEEGEDEGIECAVFLKFFSREIADCDGDIETWVSEAFCFIFSDNTVLCHCVMFECVNAVVLIWKIF